MQRRGTCLAASAGLRFLSKSMMRLFMSERFLSTFPPEGSAPIPVNHDQLTSFTTKHLRVEVPQELQSFWRNVGSGYFGDRALHVFGSATQHRDSYDIWNTKDFWPEIYPPPEHGGPVFFAETCFGAQLGFRWENGQCIYVLFVIDTFEAFRVASTGDELFEHVLSDRFALMDEAHWAGATQRFGTLSAGMHFAPIVSPLVGGTGSPGNLCQESANVHFRTAIATYRAVNGIAS